MQGGRPGGLLDRGDQHHGLTAVPRRVGNVAFGAEYNTAWAPHTMQL